MRLNVRKKKFYLPVTLASVEVSSFLNVGLCWIPGLFNKVSLMIIDLTAVSGVESVVLLFLSNRTASVSVSVAVRVQMACWDGGQGGSEFAVTGLGPVRLENQLYSLLAERKPISTVTIPATNTKAPRAQVFNLEKPDERSKVTALSLVS